MAYRGRDLNLQTPEQARLQSGQTRVGTPYYAQSVSFENRPGENRPGENRQAENRQAGYEGLVVDDTVLGCCNHAYDLALAHGAAEVGLIHLLNAMTRTDAAVVVMTNQGIDVAGLRHETASLIASDEAMFSRNENLSPRRSQDLADGLHAAAVRALQRNAPVTVADVLQSLLEMNREQPGLVMLKRNTPGWQQRTVNEAPRPEPLPPLQGGAYQIDPRYVQPEARPGDQREWVRMSSPAPGYYQPPQPGYFVAETAPQQMPQQTYYVTDAAAAPQASTVTDAVQNSRLDQMERTIRELSGELSAERKAFSQLVGELKRDVMSHTDTTSRMRGGLDDRLAGIEQMVLAVRNDGGTGSPLTADRLASLDRNVDAKFSDIARGWSVLSDRLQALETAVMSGRGDGALPFGLAERLQGLDDLTSTLAGLSDRLLAIEQAQQQRPGATAAALAPMMERLAGIERASANRSQSTVDLSPVLELLAGIELRVTEAGRGSSGVVERVAQLERIYDTTAAGGERATAQLADRLRSIEEAVVLQRNQVTQLATNLTSDLKLVGQTVTQALSSRSDVGDRIETLMGDRLQSLTSTFDRQRSDVALAVAQPLSERMGTIEKQIQSFSQRTLDLHAAHGKDLVELHDALVKLNTNQQTLAGSMDQWRLDNGTEFATFAARFDDMAQANTKPVQMLETLQTNVQSLQRSSAKREEQRSRFRQWLMGTDDWYGASWEVADVRNQPRNAPANGGVKTTASVISPQRTPVGPSNGRNNG